MKSRIVSDLCAANTALVVPKDVPERPVIAMHAQYRTDVLEALGPRLHSHIDACATACVDACTAPRLR
jgi:hypothetical protein